MWSFFNRFVLPSHRRRRARPSTGLVVLGLLAAGASAALAAPPKILVNHVGYEAVGSKKFVVQAPSEIAVTSFEVVGDDGRVAHKGKLEGAGGPGRLGKVDNWKSWRFLRGDFSALRAPGNYRIRVASAAGEGRSEPFAIATRLLPEAAMTDIYYYFKSQRSSGVFDQADRAVPLFGSPGRRVDARGGWADASGDVSKYLSHLSYANYMNPQQTPLVVWALLAASETLAPVKAKRLEALRPRLEDEALYGADFLVRMQDPAGFFYLTIFDNWSYDPKKREICAYKGQKGQKTADYRSGMREGGGLTIAALARASTLGRKSDYAPARYLAAAERGWGHLAANNSRYLDDGKENIIDDYTALLAATELYGATKKPAYLAAARARSEALMKRLSGDEKWQGFWRADAGERPFFHAAEAGLPVVALLRYRAVEPNAEMQRAVLAAVEKSLAFELAITREVFNPFGYARQYVKDVGGGKRSAFFFPHKNESGYWWQGESARQASLAAAAWLSGALLPKLAPALSVYAVDQLDWIFGLNPFDVSLMHGKGRNNPEYSPDRPNAPGGVANGITAGFDDERDIAFLPEPHASNPSQRWRWSEQWIPHGAWLTLALAARAATLPAEPPAK